MHPRILEILDHLDRHRATLQRAVAAVPPALRDRRPAPDRWSVAEVLEHLTLVEGRITQLITGRLAAVRLGAERSTEPVSPSLDMARLLDRKRSLVASDAAQPSGKVDAEDAWEELVQKRADLRMAVLAADGLALGEVAMPHPFLGSLDLYQWILFVGGHEARHAAQIRDISERLGTHEEE